MFRKNTSETQFLRSLKKRLQFLENLWKMLFSTQFIYFEALSDEGSKETDHPQVFPGYYHEDMELTPSSHSQNAMLSCHEVKGMEHKVEHNRVELFWIIWKGTKMLTGRGIRKYRVIVIVKDKSNNSLDNVVIFFFNVGSWFYSQVLNTSHSDKLDL